MIILTGVSGFIGSCLLTKLNASGFNRDVVVVDDFYKLYKDKNTDEKVVREWMHRDIFLDWFEKTTQKVDFVLHMGARTDTKSQLQQKNMECMYKKGYTSYLCFQCGYLRRWESRF